MAGADPLDPPAFAHDPCVGAAVASILGCPEAPAAAAELLEQPWVKTAVKAAAAKNQRASSPMRTRKRGRPSIGSGSEKGRTQPPTLRRSSSGGSVGSSRQGKARSTRNGIGGGGAEEKPTRRQSSRLSAASEVSGDDGRSAKRPALRSRRSSLDKRPGREKRGDS
uniref:Uncharacterized protein n=1 Tax=Lotharella globosa TaxID=91324 RepID=A0A7S4DLX9_9EUKA